MSVWGSIERRLTVLSVEWKRNIHDDDTTALYPGWHLRLTVPFIDITIQNHGWDSSWPSRIAELVRDPKNRSYWYNDEVSALGYAIGWDYNSNDGKLSVYSDAHESLLEGHRWVDDFYVH